MKTITSKQAQSRFGELVDAAQKEPVEVTRHGRVVAVILSREDYERFQAIEDAMWIAKAEAGERSGYLSVEESEARVQRILNAEA